MSSTMMSDPMLHIRGLPVSLPPVSWWLERLPIAVLILSITFLQGYALQFWDGLLGLSGWGVSFGLEVLHLWFWDRAAVSVRSTRAGWIVLAIVATGLLLAGTLHEVTQPLLQESAQIESVDQQRQSLAAEAQVLKANLAAFRDMAAGQGRRGWQDDIRRDTARLQAITDRLRALSAHSGNAARRPWLNQVTQGGVVAVAVLFQLAAVLAIWAISGNRHSAGISLRGQRTLSENCKNGSAPDSKAGVTLRTPPRTYDTGFYLRLWRGVETHAKANKARLARRSGMILQATLAKGLGINAPDLSAIKLLGEGKQVPRNPSLESVQNLVKRFALEVPK